jgi:hypothetical protein
VFAKRRYERVLRKDAKRLSLVILRAATPAGASARLMHAAPVAAASLMDWPVSSVGTEYAAINPTAARSALRGFAWWLIYQTEMVQRACDDEACKRVASALVPDAVTGLLVMQDGIVVDDQQVVAPLTVLLTGKAPEPWDPDVIAAHYIVANALAIVGSERTRPGPRSP